MNEFVRRQYRQNKTYWIFAILCIPIGILAVKFHEEPILFRLGTVVLIFIAIVVNSFVVVYSRRKWRSNPYGRALMYSKVSLALLVDITLITALLGPDWDGRAAVRVLLFGGILIAQIRLLQLLFSVRNPEARRTYDEDHDNDGNRREHDAVADSY